MIRLQNILKASLQDVLKMSWRRFCRRLEDVLKMSWQDVLKMSWRPFGKTSWRRLEDVLARRLEDVLKMSWQDVLKTYGQDRCIGLDQDVLKTSWRRLLKTNDYGEYIRLDQDVLKTSSEDENGRLLQDVFIITNVCWADNANGDVPLTVENAWYF